MKQHKLTLRKEALLNLGIRSAYKLSQATGITAPTASRYVYRPDQISALDTRALGSLLLAAAGSKERLLDLKIGDIFELQPIEQADSDQ